MTEPRTDVCHHCGGEMVKLLGDQFRDGNYYPCEACDAWSIARVSDGVAVRFEASSNTVASTFAPPQADAEAMASLRREQEAHLQEARERLAAIRALPEDERQKLTGECIGLAFTLGCDHWAHHHGIPDDAVVISEDTRMVLFGTAAFERIQEALRQRELEGRGEPEPLG